MLNACELEIDLLCRGLRIAAASLTDVRRISRTRAGLGSGLEVIIPTGSRIKSDIWVNVPVVEPFVAESPYSLARDSDLCWRIMDDRSNGSYVVRLPPEPQWSQRRTSSGIPMNRIGVLQGTCLSIYINPVCAFWNYAPPLNCRFCTTGQNVGQTEAVEKSITDVVETCRAAKEESGITFVHLNGGFQGSKGLALAWPYVRAIKQQVGLLVGLQLAPEKRLHTIRRTHRRRPGSHFLLSGIPRSGMVRADLSRESADARSIVVPRCACVLRVADALRLGLGRDHRRRRANCSHP